MSDESIYGPNPDRSAHGNIWRWMPDFGADEYGFEYEGDEFGGFFDDAGSFLSGAAKTIAKPVTSVAKAPVHIFSNAAKVAGRGIGQVTAPIQKIGGGIASGIKNIPIVGAPVHAGLSAGYHAAVSPAKMAVDIASGKNVSKVVMGELKTAVQDAKTLAPYAQTVMSFVPGVGTGVSAALGAGVALAEGQPIDQALIAATISAVPGGPIAQATAKAAAAGVQAAVRGEKFDVQKAIAPYVQTLPIPPQAKEALATGIKLTGDIAAGKRVDKAVADRALAEGMKYLDANSRKALQIGLGISSAQVMQSIKSKALPEMTGKLAEGGIQLAKTVPTIAEARRLAGPGSKGFDVAQGLLSHRASLFDIVATRARIPNPRDKMGFDMGLASRIGTVARPPSPKLSPAAQAGRAITYGMQGIPQARHKVAIMKAVQANPSATVGAKVALQTVAAERSGVVERIVNAIRSIFR